MNRGQKDHFTQQDILSDHFTDSVPKCMGLVIHTHFLVNEAAVVVLFCEHCGGCELRLTQTHFTSCHPRKVFGE